MTDLETKRLETQAMLDNADLLFDQEQCRAALQKVADDITPDPEQIKGRHVVVLDDILDEGHTMAAIQEKLLEMGAASCRAAVFANKLIDKEKPTKADYVGLDVPNRYVFGYGMDAAGCWRNLGEIYALNNK